MTTKAHVKAMVKPLLARHPDLALVGRMLVLHPVRHVLKGVFIDRTRSKEIFNPMWFAFPVFCPGRPSRLAWSNWMFSNGRLWLHEDPSEVAWLNTSIETEILPKLRAINTIADFERYARAHEANPLGLSWAQYAIPLAIALGRFDAIRDTCTNKILPRDPDTDARDEDARRVTRALQHACRLLADDDRAGLAAFLHDCEAQTVRALKIEHLWQPSPFPMEE